jgi:hypothetical protein
MAVLCISRKDVYRDTVIYSNYPSAFLNVEQFGRFKFGLDYENVPDHDAYIIRRDRGESFTELGYVVVDFEQYSVAH